MNNDYIQLRRNNDEPSKSTINIFLFLIAYSPSLILSLLLFRHLSRATTTTTTTMVTTASDDTTFCRMTTTTTDPENDDDDSIQIESTNQQSNDDSSSFSRCQMWLICLQTFFTFALLLGSEIIMSYRMTYESLTFHRTFTTFKSLSLLIVVIVSIFFSFRSVDFKRICREFLAELALLVSICTIHFIVGMADSYFALKLILFCLMSLQSYRFVIVVSMAMAIMEKRRANEMKFILLAMNSGYLFAEILYQLTLLYY